MASPSSSDEFEWNNFSSVESPEQNKNQTHIPEFFQVEEKTPEELKNMSAKERYDYVQDIKRQREFLLGKGISKSFLKGATLGTTEYIPGLKPQEGELGTVAGELLGLGLPYAGVAKLVKFIPTITKNLPKALKITEKLARSSLIGGTAKGAEEAISGKIPGKETVKSAAEFAGIHALLMTLGSTGKYVSQLLDKLPSREAKRVEKLLLGGKEIPRSIFETQEATIKELQPKLEEGRFAEEKKLPFPDLSKKGASLKDRVTEMGEDLGLRPPSAEPPKNLKEDVGRIFSDQPFYNTTKGGQTQKNIIMKADQQKYRKVNKAYDISRQLNNNINEIHPSLFNALEGYLNELKLIPAPSGPQKDLITSLEKILDALGEYTVTEEGERIFSGYKPVSNQILLDQAKSLRQKIDYDFAHGNAKNIFKPIINEIEEAALNAAKDSGNLEAAESLIGAKKEYKEWVEIFDSDYVRPFRDVTNKDYSKLYKSSLDLDEFNVLNQILDKSPEGQLVSKAMKKDLVEKNISKYFEKPKDYTTDEFKKTLRELEAVITDEESEKLLNTFKEYAPKQLKFKAKEVPKSLAKSVEKTSEYLNKPAEYIGEKLNSRSGIRQLKQDLSKTKKGHQLFEQNIMQKARSILKEGNIHKKSTTNDIYKVINKESNREILAEILGEKEINTVLDELSKKHNQGKFLTSVKDLTKNVALFKFFKFIYPLI
jgi:hypothetical protein